LNVGRYGFLGIGWVILVSAILQVCYNVELARFTLATGEVPVVAFGRTPPGFVIWVPLALICFYVAFILGGWTVSAGVSLFTLFAGRPNTPQELETVRILGIILLLTTFFFVLVGRKIVRTLEAVQGIFQVFILISLVVVTLVVVPLDFWKQSLVSIVIPARPPQGTDPTLLGALAGFTALASGLNFMIIGYYRDKGFGMGSKTGFLSGLIGGTRSKINPVGKTFPEDEKNSARWKRWFRYLLVDQWLIYFTGILIGMLVPCILVGYLSSLPGAAQPDSGSILVYTAVQLGQRYGPVMFGWALMIGFLILFTTQMIILELLARNFTDAAFSVSARFREWFDNDPRKFYYPFMFGLIIVISIFIHIALPQQLTLLSGNLSNFAALIFPLAMIYLNRQLPRPARIRWWSYVVLIANVLFFGFFFLNFLAVQITGTPLVTF
jgi:hypothetical protein